MIIIDEIATNLLTGMNFFQIVKIVANYLITPRMQIIYLPYPEGDSAFRDLKFVQFGGSFYGKIKQKTHTQHYKYKIKCQSLKGSGPK